VPRQLTTPRTAPPWPTPSCRSSSSCSSTTYRSSASSIGDDAGGAQNIIRPPLQASTNFSKAKSYLN
jgi:hypothetical protein